jgi:hypothetical protein
MKWQEIFPVLVSVFIIVLVAILQRQSRALAAILVTMPIISPLSVWIIYTGAHGERQAVSQYTQGMVVGIIPTLFFIVTLWLLSRAGLKLPLMLGLSYSVWAVVLTIVLGLKRFMGV